jgi:hypothetical protein
LRRSLGQIRDSVSDNTCRDHQRTRLVQAYACAPGQAPATPPRSIAERDTWPTTVDDAARWILAELDAASTERLRVTEKSAVVELWVEWDSGLFEGLGLRRGNDKLLESCGGGRWIDREMCALRIGQAAWTLLQPARDGAR